MVNSGIKIFSADEITDVLRNGRYHQVDVWRCLLQHMKANKVDINKYTVLQVAAAADGKTIADVTRQVNEEQIMRAVRQLENLEYRDTDAYIDICQALRLLDSRIRCVVYKYYVYGYGKREIAEMYGLEMEQAADILAAAIGTIAREVAGERKIQPLCTADAQDRNEPECGG